MAYLQVGTCGSIQVRYLYAEASLHRFTRGVQIYFQKLQKFQELSEGSERSMCLENTQIMFCS